MGAGFTGLWTAYYLLAAQPDLRVVVLEAETAGFGASGRNGGWCSALFPASLAKVAALPGSSRTAALALHREMRATVDEVLAVADREGIDARARKGGTVSVARTPAQLRSARDEVAAARAWGRGPDDVRLLDRDEARARLDAAGTLGATYTPDCAAVHPARLVRGLARAVERRGGRIHERTRVTALEPGRAVTEHGTVRAGVVVRATEGYTRSLAGLTREVVPVYSLVVATEPLPDATWERIGLRERETFTDHRNLIVYGQRTADGRMVFGGRGAPYHFGSAIRPGFDREPRVFTMLRATLVEMLPPLAGARFTHAWGRRAGRPARLGRLGRAGPHHRAGVGRRLRRRRRRYDEPGRPDAAGPGPRPRHGADPAALGGSPLAPVGARAAAVAGRQRGPARDDRGGRRGAADRTAQRRGPADGAARRRPLTAS